MENIVRLVNEYNELLENIDAETDITIKMELEEKKDKLLSNLRNELVLEHQRGNTSEQFIRLYSEFEAVTTMEMKPSDKSDKVKQDDDKEKTVYTLASDKIISSVDGSEIDISNLSRIDKIKTIYDHTGIEITIEDPEIVKLCEQRCQEFLRGCQPSAYIQKYGANWQEQVAQIYKSNYLATVHRCIANGLNEVDEKNRIREKELSSEVEIVKKREEEALKENEKLKETVDELEGVVTRLQFENKEELTKYKEIINRMIKNNSEDKSTYYSDGTVRPDMSFDEYDRYTTYRDGRANETGMQQRVNDIVHIHDSLSASEYATRQEELEQVFGQTEEKPKTR